MTLLLLWLDKIIHQCIYDVTTGMVVWHMDSELMCLTAALVSHLVLPSLTQLGLCWLFLKVMRSSSHMGILFIAVLMVAQIL